MKTQSVHGQYPKTRLRRNRQQRWSRQLIQETILSPSDLILPIFLCGGINQSHSISSMPNVKRVSIDNAEKLVELAAQKNIPSVMLFPQIDASLKTENASEAFNPDNLICRAIRHLKPKFPHIGFITDIALDPYTPHGHDGIVVDDYVVNDKTIDALVKQSLNFAHAGCDILAPSDMMDGRVGKMREALDNERHHDVKIMSYAAKYASSFYGPFRDAVGSKVKQGIDKSSYQMDPRNSDEAIREIAMDIDEGADMAIIKPGLPYLDILQRAKKELNIPLFSYHVSGEYSMLKLAADNGIISWKEGLIETMLCFKRAGANGIITYGALEVADWISQ